MRFLGILSQYIRHLFLKIFGSVFLGLLGIFLIFDFLEIQRRLMEKDASFFDKFSVVFLRAPSFFAEILPLLIFVVATYAFWRLNRNHELVICRSTGLSLWRLVFPMSVVALCIGCGNLMVFNPFSSFCVSRAETLLKKLHGKVTEEIRVESTGIWLSESTGKNQTIYRASQFDLGTLTFNNINILVVSPQNAFLERIDAKEAQIKEKTLVLRDGWFVIPGGNAQVFKERTLQTSLDRAHIERMNIDSNLLSFWKLPAYISLLERSGLKSLKYLTVWHFSVAGVAWMGVMVLLAATFTCGAYRRKKGILIAGGVFLGALLFFCNRVMFSLGASGMMSPLIAAWFLPLLVFMGAATAIFHQEDG